MAFTIRKIATLLMVAAIGASAAPTLADSDIEARASTPAVVNGNFNGPLAGSWKVETWDAMPRANVARVKDNGNYVIQVKPLPDCDAGTASAHLSGTIADVKAGSHFYINVDYKFAETTLFNHGAGYFAGPGGHTLGGATWTKNAKAGKTYTYSQLIEVKDDYNGDLPLSFGFYTCNVYDTPYPQVTFDNFRTTPA